MDRYVTNKLVSVKYTAGCLTPAMVGRSVVIRWVGPMAHAHTFYHAASIITLQIPSGGYWPSSQFRPRLLRNTRYSSAVSLGVFVALFYARLVLRTIHDERKRSSQPLCSIS